MNKTFLSFLKFDAQRVVLRFLSFPAAASLRHVQTHRHAAETASVSYIQVSQDLPVCLHISGLNVVSKKSLILIIL